MYDVAAWKEIGGYQGGYLKTLNIELPIIVLLIVTSVLGLTVGAVPRKQYIGFENY